MRKYWLKFTNIFLSKIYESHCTINGKKCSVSQKAYDDFILPLQKASKIDRFERKKTVFGPALIPGKLKIKHDMAGGLILQGNYLQFSKSVGRRKKVLVFWLAWSFLPSFSLVVLVVACSKAQGRRRKRQGQSCQIKPNLICHGF